MDERCTLGDLIAPTTGRADVAPPLVSGDTAVAARLVAAMGTTPQRSTSPIARARRGGP